LDRVRIAGQATASGKVLGTSGFWERRRADRPPAA
jgi:hypothetical protein